ncbi:uncharacterized protein [Primulina eburnea]|uniref:uncharacterized protein isoform X1 n=1 Tax=Primulina eburnea TaxID=1245227 RepID=UPI003C6CC16E
MEEEYEYTGTFPLDDPVALKNPSAESRLLNLDGNTEVLDTCETVQDSGDLMEDYGEKDVVLDSDDERGEQNEDIIMLNGDGGCVIRRSSSRDATGLAKKQNVPDGTHFAQVNPNMAREHSTEKSIDEKGLLLDNPKAIERVVNYGWEHAKLSYIESPESAESQGKALEFVDHYLVVNDLGSSADIKTRKTERIKSPPSLRSKGSQSLARRVNLGCQASKSTTFDLPEKPFMQGESTSLRSTNKLVYAIEGNNSRNLSINQESDDVYSQMKKVSSNEILAGNILSSNKSDTNSAYITESDNVGSNSGVGVAYDFIKELDKQFDAGSFRQTPGKGEHVSFPPDTMDVGLDTQMAAEAMEALVNEASPMFNTSFAHQDLDSRFTDPSSTVNKKTKPVHFVNSKEAFIGWSNKEKRSKCVKISSTVDMNKNICCSKDLCSSVSNGHHPHGRMLETDDVIKSHSPSKRKRIIGFHDDVCKMAVADGRLSKLKSRIHPKGRRFHPHALQRSNKSIKKSSCDAVVEKNAEKCPVVDEKSYDRVAKLLVYTRRRQFLAERKHSGNYINLTVDSSSPSVNDNECSGRQVEIPIDTVESSKEFSKLDDERLSPFLVTSGVTKLGALLDGNFETSQRCIGNSDKIKQPCDLLASSPLTKELARLGYTDSLPDFLPKDLRRRRVKDNFCILFSQNLDTKVLKQQQKIAARIGISIATCCAEATHFVTNNFVRTRNMLEAIARGKPVVTHSWLENCEQAGYVVDEMRYILRDDRKEKEIGFSMPVSLNRARRQPLLKGCRVFVTPNVKPNADMIICLIEAVHGEAIKDTENTLTRDKSIPDDLLFISSEEDHTMCVPFLKKGASIYNSELLLNGIVTQKLEYDRHQLFKEFEGK